jgi:hypothetical protein
MGFERARNGRSPRTNIGSGAFHGANRQGASEE